MAEALERHLFLRFSYELSRKKVTVPFRDLEVLATEEDPNFIGPLELKVFEQTAIKYDSFNFLGLIVLTS